MNRTLVVTAVVLAALSSGRCAKSYGVHGPRTAVASVVVSPAERIWVAGFVSGDNRQVDVNVETVRLLRTALRREGWLGVIDADPLVLKGDEAFSDDGYWRRLSDEHRAALIVTGSVMLTPAPPRVTHRGGPGMSYMVEPGLFLESRIILIDGLTGAVLVSQPLPRQVRYGTGRMASPLFLYLGMMDSLMPHLVRAVGSGHLRQ